jgi:hypothetical protein
MTTPSLTHDTFEPPDNYAPVMPEPGTALTQSVADPQTGASDPGSATPESTNADLISDHTEVADTSRQRPTKAPRARLLR